MFNYVYIVSVVDLEILELMAKCEICEAKKG